MQSRVACELVYLCQLLAVIDERLNTLAIFRCEVFAHNLKAALHTFTDGNARHNDDELAPPIELIQFKHRLYISICLTCTRFHFNCQAQVFYIYRFRRFQLRWHLNSPYVFQQCVRWNGQRLVAEANHVEEAPIVRTHVLSKLNHCLIALSSEHVCHRTGCIRLELLVFEFYC